MRKPLTKFASKVADYTGSPLAFIACVTFVLIWTVTGPLLGFSETWQLAVSTSRDEGGAHQTRWTSASRHRKSHA